MSGPDQGRPGDMRDADKKNPYRNKRWMDQIKENLYKKKAIEEVCFFIQHFSLDYNLHENENSIILQKTLVI